MLLRFGRLQEQLEPHARYLVRESRVGKGDVWLRLSLSAFRERCPRLATNSGVLEVMAQRHELRWALADDLESVDNRVVLTPPMIVQSTSSSCTFECLEKAHEGMAVHDLNAIATGGTWVIVNETPDNCSANRRFQGFYASLLAPRVLYAPGQCLAHKVHLVVSSASKESSVIGNCHALEFLLSVHSRRAQLAKAVGELITEELEILAGPPDSGLVELQRSLASHTWSCFRDHVRANARPTGEPPRVGTLLSILDGDWRRRRVQTHQCARGGDGDGPDDLRRQTCEQVAAAVLGSGLFSHHGTPAKSRWGSCARALSAQLCALALHDLLGRALRRAFPTYITDEVEECASAGAPQEDSDYHKQVKSKIRRVLMWTSSEGHRLLAAVVGLVSEPLDHLLQELQHRSAGHAFLLSALRPDTCLIVKAQVTLASFVCRPSRDTSLRLLYHFFAPPGFVSCLDVSNLVFRVVLQMSADLWHRCEIYFSNPPFTLAKLVDPRADATDKVKFARSLLRSHACCLDPHFGRKVALVGSRGRTYNKCDLSGRRPRPSGRPSVCRSFVSQPPTCVPVCRIALISRLWRPTTPRMPCFQIDTWLARSARGYSRRRSRTWASSVCLGRSGRAFR